MVPVEFCLCHHLKFDVVFLDLRPRDFWLFWRDCLIVMAIHLLLSYVVGALISKASPFRFNFRSVVLGWSFVVSVLMIRFDEMARFSIGLLLWTTSYPL